VPASDAGFYSFKEMRLQLLIERPVEKPHLLVRSHYPNRYSASQSISRHAATTTNVGLSLSETGQDAARVSMLTGKR
jgi:hypothetical protein